MVIDFLSRKISKEIEFVTDFCSDKDLMAVTANEAIYIHWGYIFNLAEKTNLSDGDKDILFEEINLAHDLCMILAAMTKCGV